MERDETLTLRNENYKLKQAFEKLYGIVANTVWGTKKVVQVGAVVAAYVFYGRLVAAIVLGVEIIIELLDSGYEKMLELKADLNKS